MPLMCAWCMYQRVRNWITMDKVRTADTIIAGDALCAEHFVDWTVLRAHGSWRFNEVMKLLESEKR